MSSFPLFVRGLLVGSLLPIAVLTLFFPSAVNQTIKQSLQQSFKQSINVFNQWSWLIVGLIVALPTIYLYYDLLIKPIKKHGFLNQSNGQLADQSNNQSTNQDGSLPWTLKSAVSKRNRSTLPVWNPHGWYRLMDCFAVRPGDVVPYSALEQELVIFRAINQPNNQSNSQPSNQTIGLPPLSVLDAYCPHLGAHMGYGGKVTINQSSNLSESQSVLVCPFHGWEFDLQGQCQRIPYAKRVPDIAKTKAYVTSELLRGVFVWIDPHQSNNQSNSQSTTQSTIQSNPSTLQHTFLGNEPVLEANADTQSLQTKTSLVSRPVNNPTFNQSIKDQFNQFVNSCHLLSAANRFLNNQSTNRLIGSLDFEVGGHIREVWETLIQSRSINQSINRSFNQTINFPTYRAQRKLSVGWHIDEPVTDEMKQSIIQSNDQSLNPFQNVTCSLVYNLEITVLGMKINRTINQTIIQPGFSLLSITQTINQSVNQSTSHKQMYGTLSVIPQSPFVQSVNLSIYGNQSINPVDSLIDRLVVDCLIEFFRQDARSMQSCAEKRARSDESANQPINQSNQSVNQDDQLINQFRDWFDCFDQSISRGAQSNQVRRREGTDW